MPAGSNVDGRVTVVGCPATSGTEATGTNVSPTRREIVTVNVSGVGGAPITALSTVTVREQMTSVATAAATTSPSLVSCNGDVTEPMVGEAPAGIVAEPPSQLTVRSTASVFVTVNQNPSGVPAALTVSHCATMSNVGLQSRLTVTSGNATPLMATAKVCTPSPRP